MDDPVDGKIYDGHGECVEPSCRSVLHRYEAITNDDGDGIGSSYTCLWCGSLDVRFSNMYRNEVLDDFIVEEPEVRVIWFTMTDDGDLEIVEGDWDDEDDE